MAKSKKGTRGTPEAPTCVALANSGISTASDFLRMMTALLADTVTGRVQPQTANATCNVAGKIIRMVEMQHKYGRQVEGSTERLLALTPLAPEAPAPTQVQ